VHAAQLHCGVQTRRPGSDASATIAQRPQLEPPGSPLGSSESSSVAEEPLVDPFYTPRRHVVGACLVRERTSAVGQTSATSPVYVVNVVPQPSAWLRISALPRVAA